MWHEEAVFYQIYPLGFCGAPFENDGKLEHRILKVKDWIEHFKYMNINAIYFSPIFESDTHGYNTRDYGLIDSRLGTNEDFKKVVDELHKAGIKVVLDGVDIANESGPAIFIDEAKKCTVELLDGTTSVLKDGAKDKINDGVIFSNDTLRIKGGGELCIYSNNAHGIASDDDVIIEDGIFEINSIKSGIFAHDDITVNGGELTVFGGTNGLKSKGTININGGRCVISGGTKEEKSSVYAGAALNYTGGSLFAAGNQVTTPSTSVNPFVVVDLGGSYDADSTVEMLLDSTQMVSFQPHNNFRCLMMLTPEIGVGSSYKTIIDGKEGKEFTLSDGQNLVTFE